MKHTAAVAPLKTFSLPFLAIIILPFTSLAAENEVEDNPRYHPRTHHESPITHTIYLARNADQPASAGRKSALVEDPDSPTSTNPQPAEKGGFGSCAGTFTAWSKGKIISSEPSIIVLEREEVEMKTSTEPRNYNIKMTKKRFLPRYNLIRVNDTVKFENYDRFLHNVFSLSGNNKFDLGSYGRGKNLEYQFEEPGLVKVYCNIHPGMASFIMVSRSEWGVVTDKSGAFDIKRVPPGEYELVAWNIRGEHREKVVIRAGEKTTVKLDIDSSTYRRIQHLNKHGERYKRRSIDESY